VIVHIVALHEHGSNNPLGINSNIDKIPFHPYYSIKDLFGYAVFLIFFVLFICYAPNLLGRLWPFVFKIKTNAMCYMLELYNNHNITNIISGLFKDKNPNMVKIYYDIYNQQVTKLFFRIKVGTSETIRTQKILYSKFSSNENTQEEKFNQ
jgi:quinol-cytochrome oxidoreductase complex cytochrome b subunit